MSDKDKKPIPPRTTTNETSYEIRGTSEIPKFKTVIINDNPKPKEKK